jgi:hypothetical protein
MFLEDAAVHDDEAARDEAESAASEYDEIRTRLTQRALSERDLARKARAMSVQEQQKADAAQEERVYQNARYDAYLKVEAEFLRLDRLVVDLCLEGNVALQA